MSMAPAAPPVVHLRDAAFGYGERAVVSGVSLDVAPGEVVGVLGPNGAGKSTLVKGLLGLAEQVGGEVDLFGVPRSRFEEHTRVGYVPQRHTLATSVRATVEEVVAIGRVPHLPWWAPWRAHSRHHREVVASALRTVGLAEHARDDVATLSGGQQRRVLIARALAAQPELLVLDEPTAGVDVGHQRVLATVLRRLVDDGATLLLVTHELAPFADLVTRALLVRGGRVVHDGPPGQLPADEPGVVAGGGHHHDDEDPAPGGSWSPVPTGLVPGVRP